MTNFTEKFFRRHIERIRLKNAADDDHRMCAYDIDDRIASELGKIVNANDHIFVAAPHVIHPRLEFDEIVTSPDDASARAEILLLSSSILVPCLRHDGATVWDTLAIGEYLNDLMPEAGLLPSERIPRAHCRSICGEIHSGFTTLRSSLPVNIKGHFPKFKIWAVREPAYPAVRTISPGSCRSMFTLNC